MKKILTFFAVLFVTSLMFAQNTADLFIENATVNGNKYTWEIYITRTNDWGSNQGDNALGDCSWFFNYNSAALSNPVITFVGSIVDAAHYDNTTGVSGGKVFVDTKIHNFDPGVDLTQGTKYHVYTVEMDITDASQQAEVTWNETDTGIFNASDDASVDETYFGTGDIPLPVELQSFKATNQKGSSVELEWATATEVNNYGFEIERKVVKAVDENEEAGTWEKVAFVEGSGNSNSQKIYNFVDKNPVGGTTFAYRLKQIDIDGTFEYSDEIEVKVLPSKYDLYQNYPNPFNPTTKIKFSLPENAKVKIAVYDILGRELTTLINKNIEAGYHSINFDAAQFTSGVYLYTIETSKFTKVKKMLLLK